MAFLQELSSGILKKSLVILKGVCIASLSLCLVHAARVDVYVTVYLCMKWLGESLVRWLVYLSGSWAVCSPRIQRWWLILPVCLKEVDLKTDMIHCTNKHALTPIDVCLLTSSENRYYWSTRSVSLIIKKSILELRFESSTCSSRKPQTGLGDTMIEYFFQTSWMTFRVCMFTGCGLGCSCGCFCCTCGCLCKPTETMKKTPLLQNWSICLHTLITQLLHTCLPVLLSSIILLYPINSDSREIFTYKTFSNSQWKFLFCIVVSLSFVFSPFLKYFIGYDREW